MARPPPAWGIGGNFPGVGDVNSKRILARIPTAATRSDDTSVKQLRPASRRSCDIRETTLTGRHGMESMHFSS
jgi:hypothetical protein